MKNNLFLFSVCFFANFVDIYENVNKDEKRGKIQNQNASLQLHFRQCKQTKKIAGKFKTEKKVFENSNLDETIGYSCPLLEKRCTFRKRPYFGIKVGFERGDLCFSFCIQPEEIASSASIIQLHSIVAGI